MCRSAGDCLFNSKSEVGYYGCQHKNWLSIPTKIFLRGNDVGHVYWKQNSEHLLKRLQVYLSKGKQNRSGNILALPCLFLLVKG